MRKIITFLTFLIVQVSFAQTIIYLENGFKIRIPQGCTSNSDNSWVTLPDAMVGEYYEKTFGFEIPFKVKTGHGYYPVADVNRVEVKGLNLPDGLKAYGADGNECQPHCTFGPTGNGDWSELVIKGTPTARYDVWEETHTPKIGAHLYVPFGDSDISGYIPRLWFSVGAYGCTIENDCNFNSNATEPDYSFCSGPLIGSCDRCENNILVDNDYDDDGDCDADDECWQNAYAFRDDSGECVGGDTGKEACTYDCENVCGGSAIYITYYEDSDKDGFGDPKVSREDCSTINSGDDWVKDQNTDNCPKVENVDQKDFDGDGLGDVCDPDDDNDGWPDEAGEFKGTIFNAGDSNPESKYLCGDSDNDTCDDCTNGVYNLANDGLDTDGDGICNVGDDDDDNDGCLDAIDPNLSLVFVNTDGDDQANDCDDDDDNDGVTDTDEVLNRGAPLDPSVCGDSDKDGCDDCSQISATNYTKNTKADIDNDGSDTDGDGKCDLGDHDDDNDGVVDGQDSNPDTYNECRDLDGDSCDDCSKIADFSKDARADTYNDGGDFDKDGLCDMGDPDDDNDGALDGNDTDDNNKFICSDIDNDGCDDCTSGRYNPEADGDAEDKDDDDDGVDDADDYCDYDSEGIYPHVKWMGIGKYENWKSDDENDRDGDGCRDEDEDLDDDDDGVADILDQCISSDSAFNWKSQPTTDYDGDGCKDDEEDEDDDNDGIDDQDDSCDPDSDGEIIPYVNWMGIGNYENWKSDDENDRDKDGCRDVDEDENDDNDGCSDPTETSPKEYNSGIQDKTYYLDYDGDGLSQKSGVYGGQDVFCSNNVPALPDPQKWMLEHHDDPCPNRPVSLGKHPDECGKCGGLGKQDYFYDDDGDGYGARAGDGALRDSQKFCGGKQTKGYVSKLDATTKVQIFDECPFNAGLQKDPSVMGYDCDGKIIGKFIWSDTFQRYIAPTVQKSVLFHKGDWPDKKINADGVYVVNSPYFQIGYIADKDAQAIDFQNGLPVVWLEDGINSNVTYSKADNACQSRVKIYRRSNTESVYYEHWYIPEIDMLEHMKEVSRADNHDLATLTYYWSSTGTDTHKKIFKDVQGVSSIEERAITDSYRYIPIHKIGPKGPLEQDYNH